MSTRPLLIVSLIGLTLLAGCGPTSAGLKARAEARQRLDVVNAELASDQAEQAFLGGQFDRATKEIHRAIALHPEWAEYRVLEGRIYLETHRLEKALLSFDTAIELKPKLAEAHYYAGIVCQRWSEDERAYNYYMAAFEAAPDSVEYLLAAAESLVAMEQFDSARHLLESKLGYFEHNAAMRHLLGEIALLQGDANEAADLYAAAWRLTPEDPIMLNELAQVQFAAERYGDCYRSVKQLQELTGQQDHPDLMHLEAQCLAYIDRQPEARALYLALTKLDPTNVDLWVELGTLAWELGDYHRMALCGARVTALAPARYEGYMLKGVNERHHGDLEEAVMFLKQAAERAPSTALPHLVLGRVLEQLGDKPGALEAYTEAIRIDPDNADAQALFIDGQERLLTAQHPDSGSNE